MISPYVRRRRLAAEIIRLREDHGYTAAALAQAIGVGRQRISRLENGHVRPDLDEIMRILDTLGVGEKRWNQIMTIAREAAEHGWWEKFADEMGPRQALYANLEAGARSIHEYQMTLLPGCCRSRRSRSTGPAPTGQPTRNPSTPPERWRTTWTSWPLWPRKSSTR